MAAVNHSERKRLIVAKAMQLFARMGYSKVSFLDVSEATGIARTALYRCYRTKREIFDDAIGRALSELRTIVNAVLAEKAPAADRLEKVCGIVAEPGKRGLCFPELCRSDHLHGLCDLAGVLDALDARADGSQVCHIQALLTPRSSRCTP